jgi:hypothetical protein
LLVTESSVNARPRNLALEGALTEFYHEDDPEKTHLCYISVVDRECIKSELNHSKSKIQNATVCANLAFNVLTTIAKEQFDFGKNLLFLPGYQNQVRIIHQLL